MSVLIEAIPDTARVRVTGDIVTTLTVPFEDDDRFMVGLSDGTLLIGSYDDDMRCRFDVARDGAGFVRFEGNAARVDWQIEWATVSTYDANVVESPALGALPLFGDHDLDDQVPW